MEVVANVLLQPRSLLVFRDQAYTHVKHRMVARESDVVTDNTVNAALAQVKERDVFERSRRVRIHTLSRANRNSCH